MADIHNEKTRSYNMRQIKAKDTKPELLVRKYLHSKGLRYRLHGKNLPGKPDIFFSRKKVAIFINGCFWHGHDNCNYFKLPKTRTEWWREKIKKTKDRDKNHVSQLQAEEWTCLTVWECQLKPIQRQETLESLCLLIQEVQNK